MLKNNLEDFPSVFAWKGTTFSAINKNLDALALLVD
jgi:hypothetical protein